MTKPMAVETEDQRRRVLDLIAALNVEKKWQVTVERKTKRRTLNQNSLYHKWIGEVVKGVSEHTGMDHDDIHEFFKHKFLTPRIIEVGGVTVERYTTRHLTTLEMKEYMDRIYAFCTTELGMLLPLPEEAHMR